MGCGTSTASSSTPYIEEEKETKRNDTNSTSPPPVIEKIEKVVEVASTLKQSSEIISSVSSSNLTVEVIKDVASNIVDIAENVLPFGKAAMTALKLLKNTIENIQVFKSRPEWLEKTKTLMEEVTELIEQHREAFGEESEKYMKEAVEELERSQEKFLSVIKRGGFEGFWKASEDQKKCVEMHEKVKKLLTEAMAKAILVMKNQNDNKIKEIEGRLETFIKNSRINTKTDAEQQMDKVQQILLQGILPPVLTLLRSLPLYQPGTRLTFIEKFDSFLSINVEEKRYVPNRDKIFWIQGEAGTGKTILAAMLCDRFSEQALAYHFCRHDESKSRSPLMLIRFIVYQLAQHLPTYRKIIHGLISAEKFSIEEDETKAVDVWTNLITNPLASVQEINSEEIEKYQKKRAFILIDALDESINGGANKLLDLLCKKASDLPSWLAVLITSRPEENIEQALKKAKLTPTPIECKEESNMKDIQFFLEQQMKKYTIIDGEMSNAIHIFMEKCEGRFLYASKMLEELNERYDSTDSNPISISVIQNLPKGLEGFYENSFKRINTEGVEKMMLKKSNFYFDRNVFMNLIKLILTAIEPLSVEMLCDFAECEIKHVSSILKQSKAFFKIRKEDEDEIVEVHHKSVTDWFTSDDRINDEEEEEDQPYVDVMKQNMIWGGICWKRMKTNEEEETIKAKYKQELDHLYNYITDEEDRKKLSIFLPNDNESLYGISSPSSIPRLCVEDISNLIDKCIEEGKSTGKVVHEEVIKEKINECINANLRFTPLYYSIKYGLLHIIHAIEEYIDRIEKHSSPSIPLLSLVCCLLSFICHPQYLHLRIMTNDLYQVIKEILISKNIVTSLMDEVTLELSIISGKLIWCWIKPENIMKEAETFGKNNINSMRIISNMVEDISTTLHFLQKTHDCLKELEKRFDLFTYQYALSMPSDSLIFEITSYFLPWFYTWKGSEFGLVLWLNKPNELSRLLTTFHLPSHVSSHINSYPIKINPSKKIKIEAKDHFAVSYNGKFLAVSTSIEANQYILVYDTEIIQIKKLIQIDSHNTCMTFLPNENYIITGNINGDIHMWNIEKEMIECEFKGHSNYIISLYLTPNGKRLISRCEEKIIVWDIESGSKVKIFDLKQIGNNIENVRYRIVDNYLKQIFVEGYGIYDFKSSEKLEKYDSVAKFCCINRYTSSQSGVKCDHEPPSIDFTLDGENILLHDHFKTFVFDCKNPEKYVGFFESHYYRPLLQHFSSDGKFYFSFEHDTLYLKSMKNYTEKSYINSTEADCVMISTDSKFMFTVHKQEGKVYVNKWNLTDYTYSTQSLYNDEFIRKAIKTSYEDLCISDLFSKNAVRCRFIGSNDNFFVLLTEKDIIIRIFDLKTLKETNRIDPKFREFKFGPYEINPLDSNFSVSPCGKYITCRSFVEFVNSTPSIKVQKWNIDNGMKLEDIDISTIMIDPRFTSPDGQHHYRESGPNLFIYNKRKHNLIEIKNTKFQCFSSDSKKLIVYDREKKENSLVILENGTIYPLSSVSESGFSPDGKLLVIICSLTDQIKINVWNTEDFEEDGKMKKIGGDITFPKSLLQKFSFSSDCKKLLFKSSGEIAVYGLDTESSKSFSCLIDFFEGVELLNGRLFLIFSKGHILSQIWYIANGINLSQSKNLKLYHSRNLSDDSRKMTHLFFI